MCQRFAISKSREVVKFFSEKGITGRRDRRPALDEMVAFIKSYNKENPQEPIRIILSDELDRMARNQEFYRRFKREMLKIGVKLKNMKIDFSDNAS